MYIVLICTHTCTVHKQYMHIQCIHVDVHNVYIMYIYMYMYIKQVHCFSIGMTMQRKEKHWLEIHAHVHTSLLYFEFSIVALQPEWNWLQPEWNWLQPLHSPPNL